MHRSHLGYARLTGIGLLTAALSCGDARERTSSVSSTPSAATDTAKIAADIRRLSEVHAKAARARDSSGVGAIFAEDARYMPGYAEDASAGGVAETWRRAMGIKGLTIGYTPKDIKVARSGDLAVEVGAISNTMNGKPLDTGHYIYVWQPRSGEWKVTDYIWTTYPAQGAKPPR